METKADFGRYFEDFQVGEIIKHKEEKTISKTDNELFCKMTMNSHPLHFDSNYAQKTYFKQCVVVGTYVLSLAVGISVKDISYKAIANLGFSSIIHHLPTFIGDTISAETETLSNRISNTNNEQGIVCVETRAYNQNNQKILTLQRQILVPRNGKK